MLPHATRRDDVAGNKQVYGGVRTYKRYVGDLPPRLDTTLS